MRQKIYYLQLITLFLGLYACRQTTEIAPVSESIPKHTRKSGQSVLRAYREGRFADALRLSRSPENTSVNYNLLGAVYQQLDQPRKAYKAYQTALRQRRIQNGATHHSLSNVYNNLGNLAHSRQQYTRALDYYTRALAIADTAQARALIYNNISKTYLKQGRYTRAKTYATRALADCSPADKYLIKTTLGVFYRETGNYTAAENFFLEALSDALQTVGTNAYQIAYIYNHLAYFYYLQEKFDQTTKYSDIACQMVHAHQKIKNYSQTVYTFIHKNNEKVREKLLQELAPPDADGDKIVP